MPAALCSGDADTTRTRRTEPERTPPTQAISSKHALCRRSCAARDLPCPRLRSGALLCKQEVTGSVPLGSVGFRSGFPRRLRPASGRSRTLKRRASRRAPVAGLLPASPPRYGERVRHRFAVFIAVLAYAALALPGPAAAADARRCGTIVLTPSSGDGLFDVTARNVSCRRARQVLGEWARAENARRWPAGYRCRVVRRYMAGSRRVRCTRPDGERMQRIGFTTGT